MVAGYHAGGDSDWDRGGGPGLKNVGTAAEVILVELKTAAGHGHDGK